MFACTDCIFAGNQGQVSSVLLAVIGPNWLDARDEHGNRRLDDPNDFLRIEIATALQRNIPVIPILVGGSRIPKADRLPEDLKELEQRNALDVRHTSFHSDVDKLIQGLKGLSDQDRKAKETEYVSRTPSDDARVNISSKEKANASAPRTVADTTDRARSAAASNSSNWARWASPAILAVPFIAFIGAQLYFTGGFGGKGVPAKQVTQQAPTATPSASVATADQRVTQQAPNAVQSTSVSTADLGKRAIDILASLRTSLQNITDRHSAAAAYLKLLDAMNEISNVRGQVAKLPPEQRRRIAGMINSSVETLNQLFDKVLAIPGVSEQLKPIVDTMRADLATLIAAWYINSMELIICRGLDVA
jgi:hypothetical protein